MVEEDKKKKKKEQKALNLSFPRREITSPTKVLGWKQSSCKHDKEKASALQQRLQFWYKCSGVRGRASGFADKASTTTLAAFQLLY